MTPTPSAALKASLSVIFSGTLVLGGLSAPALAASKAKPDKQRPARDRPAKPASGRPAPAVTEDNDNDGVANNVVDGGDNRHPSGRDRSVERGGSGNQGKSRSDPDGNSNGGVDRPGGSGGVDQHDQDGNNGCGNDDDFEDDNNGNCGRRRGPKAKPSGSHSSRPRHGDTPAIGGVASPLGTVVTQPSATSGVASPLGTVVTPPSASVLGVEVERPGNILMPHTGPFPHGDVLAARFSRLTDPTASLAESLDTTGGRRSTGQSGNLPRTGSGADDLAQLALLLLGAGGTMVLATRRRPHTARAG